MCHALHLACDYIASIVGFAYIDNIRHAVLTLASAHGWAECRIRSECTRYKLRYETALSVAPLRAAQQIAETVASFMNCAYEYVYPYALASAARIPRAPPPADVVAAENAIYGGFALPNTNLWPSATPSLTRTEFDRHIRALSMTEVTNALVHLGLHRPVQERPVLQRIAWYDLESGHVDCLPALNTDLAAMYAGAPVVERVYVRTRDTQSTGPTDAAAMQTFIVRAVMQHVRAGVAVAGK